MLDMDIVHILFLLAKCLFSECIWVPVVFSLLYRVFTSSKLPANFRQTSTLARVFKIYLLGVCWTFAGSCKHPISV